LSVVPGKQKITVKKTVTSKGSNHLLYHLIIFCIILSSSVSSYHLLYHLIISSSFHIYFHYKQIKISFCFFPSLVNKKVIYI